MGLPTALVLVLALPQDGFVSHPDPRTLPLDELIRRLPAVGAEWIEVDGLGTLHPATAEFRRRVSEGTLALDESQWRHLLFDTDSLRARTRWPAGIPFALHTDQPLWLADGQDLWLTPLEPTFGQPVRVWRESSDCGVGRMIAFEARVHQELGTLPAGPLELRFLIQLRMHGSEPSASGALLTGELRLPVEIVPTLEDALPPVSSPELDQAVRNALVLDRDRDELWLRYRPDPLLRGVALALELEFLEKGEVRARKRASPTDEEVFGSRMVVERLVSLPPALAADAGARKGWSVRVRGTSDGVLRSWSADRYWNGCVELTLEELFARPR